MNKILTAIAVVLLFSGCSSMQHASDIPPAERHQAAKTKYYEDLNQGRLNASAEVEEETENVLAER